MRTIPARCKLTHLDLDEYGHIDGETDPYEHITWSIGSDDDFTCFDAKIVTSLNDGKKYIILHAVLNSETGGFIQDVWYEVVPLDEGVATAQLMVDNAVTWCVENDIKGIGWVNDCQEFVEYVELYIGEV